MGRADVHTFVLSCQLVGHVPVFIAPQHIACDVDVAGGHVVNALGDGDWAVVTVSHCVDGRDVVERHWGRSVPGEWKETRLVRLAEKRDSRLVGLPGHTRISKEHHFPGSSWVW